MEPDPASSLDALVSRVRAAIAGPSDPGAAPEQLIGTAAEGQVTVEATPDGSLRSVTVDPALLRTPLVDICAHIVTAANAALAQRPERPDTAPLLDELRAAQEQSVQEMSKISQAFSDALARASQR